jgi:hypothetical protein
MGNILELGKLGFKPCMSWREARRDCILIHAMADEELFFCSPEFDLENYYHSLQNKI